MAKTKSNGRSTKSSSKNRSRSRKNRVSRGITMLDPAARAYAQLLMDPCGAPLVHPVYAGSGSGYLVRVSKVFVLSTSGAGESVSVNFSPGQMSTATTGWVSDASPIGAVQYAKYESSAGGYKLWNDRESQPGYTFFYTGAQNVAVRPVAGCLKARYVGTELNRGGSVYTGYLPNAESYFVEAAPSGSVSPNFNASLCTAAQFSTRTPDGSVEVKWAPGRGDMRFRDITTGSELKAGSPINSSVFANFVGLPAGSTLEFTLTAVYEWVPNASSGLQIPTQTTKSTSSLDAVLGYLQSFGSWYLGGTQSAQMARNLTGRLITSGLAGNYPRIEL